MLAIVIVSLSVIIVGTECGAPNFVFVLTDDQDLLMNSLVRYFIQF